MAYLKLKDEKEGKWLVTLSKGSGEDRKRKKITIKGYFSEKDAEEKANQLEELWKTNPCDEEIFAVKTFSDLVDWYEAMYCTFDEEGNTRKGELRESTVYRDICTLKRLRKEFGSFDYDEITPSQIQGYLLDLGRCKRGVKGLSSKTIKNIFQVMTRIYTYAIQDAVIHCPNPCKKVQKKPAKSGKVNVLDEKGEQELINCLKKSMNDGEIDLMYFTAIIFLLETGVRKGELLALEWKDIDFESREIHVNKARQRINGVVKDVEVKTENSIRCIDISNCLCDLLTRLKDDIQSKGKFTDDEMSKMKLLVNKRTYKPIDPDSLYQWFSKYQSKHGFTGDKKVTLHSLRHTSISRLVGNGLNMESISLRAGHASINTTGNIYTHKYRSKDKALKASIDELKLV